MNNILVINKEKGISSNNKLMEVKREYNLKKCGFVGTLDPFATGLLIVCCNQYTKLVDYFHLFSKTYVATIVFGMSTDTLDETGEFNYKDNFVLNRNDFQKLLDSTSEYDQIPPQFSAKRVNGKRSYEYAREGKTVKLKPKRVKILSSEIISIENNTAKVRFEVSSGTYIRSLGDDFAKMMGTRAYLTDLHREKIGEVDVNDSSVNIDKVLNIKQISVTNDFEAKLVRNGQLPNNYKDVIDNEGLYNIYYNDKKIALYEYKNKKWKIVISFNGE